MSELLVVGNEAATLGAVRGALEAAGHRVRTAALGADALTLMRIERPDLMVIDMLLPDLSGLGLCRAIREEPRIERIPIVMLATSSAEMDRIVAFEIGVDDFVQQPCSLRELTLRVAAILRRTLQGGPPHPAGPLRAGPLIVDPDRREAKVGGSDARLTAREFDVLVTLMRHPGRVLARKQILEEVWGVASDKTVRVVDTHVKWIRRKIGPAGRYIETLRGVGYRFTDQLSDQDAGGEPTPVPSRHIGCGEASVGGEHPERTIAGASPLSLLR